MLKSAFNDQTVQSCGAKTSVTAALLRPYPVPAERAQSVTVQIFQADVKRSAAAVAADNALLKTSRRASAMAASAQAAPR